MLGGPLAVRGHAHRGVEQPDHQQIALPDVPGDLAGDPVDRRLRRVCRLQIAPDDDFLTAGSQGHDLVQIPLGRQVVDEFADLDDRLIRWQGRLHGTCAEFRQVLLHGQLHRRRRRRIQHVRRALSS